MNERLNQPNNEEESLKHFQTEFLGPQVPELKPLRDSEKQEIESEDRLHLETEKVILRCADDPKFREAILPQNPEQINVKSLDKALETLLNTDSTDISKLQRLELFKQALDYYSEQTDVKTPLWHSTSSYSLRKSLEEGFTGGHGKYAGEASVKIEEGEKTQDSLSVSHPEYHYAEVFQQMFARATAKKSELAKYLVVDSEKITGKKLPQVFIEEMLSSFSKNELKALVAKRMGVRPEEVTDEQAEQMTSEESRRIFIEDFDKREDTHRREKIKAEVLPNIPDEKLRGELEQELDHPFPCFVTFEGAGKKHNLTTFSRGEKPTYIPFEDRYWDTLAGEDIREIRVPQNQIEKVQGWIKQKGLKGVRVVPIEVYEIKRVIQDKAEK